MSLYNSQGPEIQRGGQRFKYDIFRHISTYFDIFRHISTYFDIFRVLEDNVVAGLTERFKAISIICELISFLWRFQAMSNDKLGTAVVKLTMDNLTGALTEEIINLKRYFKVNCSVDHFIKPL